MQHFVSKWLHCGERDQKKQIGITKKTNKENKKKQTGIKKTNLKTKGGEGRKEGRREGRKEGSKEGRKEGRKKERSNLLLKNERKASCS